MKLLIITTVYPTYESEFYKKRPELAEKSFVGQKAALDFHAFGWADFWSQALKPLNYEVRESTWNVGPLQLAWARENILNRPETLNLKDIAVAQAKSFEPDVVWFDGTDEELLERIRTAIPSIRLVLGWVGSAIPATKIWKQIDLILSCAPESVEYLRGLGLRASQIHHGFDPRINGRLNTRSKQLDVTFIGQLIKGSGFHDYREKFLEEIASAIKPRIFCPNGQWGKRNVAKVIAKRAIFRLGQSLRGVGIRGPVVRRIEELKERSDTGARVNSNLSSLLTPAVYGLEMFRTVRNSKVVLNIHADSSPLYASNMRLFETTGVGTCLVTDHKKNLGELFEFDEEVIVYRTPEECIEKVTWLLEHPAEREEIARAGQKRTLEDHTFAKRARQLDAIIRSELGKKSH